MTTTSANVSPPAQTSADFNAAMDRIRDELAKNKRDSVNTLGEIMTQLLQRFPEIAGELLNKGKSLAGCWDAMEKYAKDHKTGNCYAMPPDVAENIIVEYYGLRLPTRVWETEFSKGVVEAAKPEGTTSSGAGAPPSPEGEGQVTPPKAFPYGEGGPRSGSDEVAANKPADPFDLDALMGVL